MVYYQLNDISDESLNTSDYLRSYQNISNLFHNRLTTPIPLINNNTPNRWVNSSISTQTNDNDRNVHRQQKQGEKGEDQRQSMNETDAENSKEENTIEQKKKEVVKSLFPIQSDVIEETERLLETILKSMEIPPMPIFIQPNKSQYEEVNKEIEKILPLQMRN